MKQKKIYIYGLCNVFYDSYYIKGLRDNFSNIEFNISKFPKFNQGTFAFIIVDQNFEKKIIIDSRDTNCLDFVALKWCDKYGKINYLESVLPIKDKDKIIAIGPSFGIKIWNFFETFWFGLRNYLKFQSKITNKREFIANYWRQYNRLNINLYSPSNSMDKEVFFISSIWKQENSTNNYRATFIKTCKKNKIIKFEGGFVPRNDGDNIGFDSLIYPKRISISSYISKIKKSAFVFNTPAVLSCHGWKLAEFLALGKAIISTHHINLMPEPLKEDIHILYVEDIFDFEKQINKIINNNHLKKKLEKNSREYFEKNLTPKAVIQRLLN